ncbi:MAG TPA: sulfite exporter TauE/SafE family protein [Afipia sp.]
MIYVFVLIVGLVAGVLSGIVGTGSSIMLVPVLAYAFGPKQAVPIMAIAAIMANLSRIIAWWREVDWRATAAYSVPAVPAAVLGARTLLVLPPRAADIAIGVFLLAMIPLRRWMAAHSFALPLWSLAAVGLFAGYLTGIVASTGPMTIPIFMSYGLVKGALLGTEAACSLAVYISKALTFRRFDALPYEVILQGLIAGSSLFAGAFVAKRFVLKLDPESFRLLMDGMMLVAGLSMLWNAFWG